MSYFKLPKTLYTEMERLMGNFWWGQKEYERKIHWNILDKMCIPKCKGGMGFRNLHSFNLAILVKQGWRILKDDQSLLHKIYKARYFPHFSLFDS